jgi:predicted outer membrane lipoprotein
LFHDPGLSLRSNPGLKLANAFGVIQALHHNWQRFGVIQALHHNWQRFGVYQIKDRLTDETEPARINRKKCNAAT